MKEQQPSLEHIPIILDPWKHISVIAAKCRLPNMAIGVLLCVVYMST